jgi:hypothetical protein
VGHLSGRIILERKEEPAVDAKKAESANMAKLLIPNPPEFTGKEA